MSCVNAACSSTMVQKPKRRKLFNYKKNKVQNKIPNIAITDISPVCHMPDVIEAPYRPFLMNEPDKGINVILAGPSCLAGDIIGEYNFKRKPKIGDKVVFLDQAHYTLVKTNFFNGINHPEVVLWNSDNNEFKVIKTFDFKDFETRN